VRYAAKLLIGLLILALVLQFVDIRAAMLALRDVRIEWVLASVACYVATRVLQALKWWIWIGGSNSPTSYPTVQRAMCLADYYGLLFPNSLAVDVLRVTLMRHHAGGIAQLSAGVLADRVTNVALTALVSLVAIAVAWIVQGALPFTAAVTGAVLTVVGIVFAACVVLASPRLMGVAFSLLDGLARLMPRVAIVRRVLAGGRQVQLAMMAMLTSRRTLVPGVALGLMLVLARVGSTYFLFHAVGAPQPFVLTLMLVPVITLIVLIPISILGLGVKEGAFVFFFGGAGVAAIHAVGVSLVSYVVIIASTLVLGLLASVIGPPLPSRSEMPRESSTDG